MNSTLRPLTRLATLLLAAFLATSTAVAHRLDPLELAAREPAAGAAVEVLSGVVRDLVIDDRVAGATTRHRALLLGDGTAIAITGDAAQGLASASRVEVTGRRNGKMLFVTAARAEASSVRGTLEKSRARHAAEGELNLVHVDYFESDRSEFLFEVHGDDGTITPLALPVRPDALQRGMRVIATGASGSDGAIEPDSIVITALPAAEPRVAALTTKAVKTNQVLVILMRFADSGTQPFTQAQVQATFAGGPGSGSVTEYFREASYGQQLLNATVTPWLQLTSATPVNCDWRTMGTLGRSAATAAGYSTSGYQNVVYVFPRVAACGWAGLGYIGASGVWINGYNQTKVYGHELGHNFGLLHAASLDCGGAVIGGTCRATEYGDLFGMMGNQTAMHFSAPQKLDLGWIASTTVRTHTTGTATYVLNPLETPGGATYAIRVPAAANRTYWLEYRQPIGFDGGLGSYPSNGAQVRVASPFETMCSGCDAYSNDTQLLDMTPATASFGDSALVVGRTYTDPSYGISFEVVSATAGALTVQVRSPGGTITATSTSLASSQNPVPAGTSVTFTASVSGTAPTGSVAFTDNGTAVAGCAAVALTGTGNVRTAACSTSALPAGTHNVVARYAGDAANGASSSVTLAQVISAVASVPLVNGGFETPNVGTGYQYAPVGTGVGWTFGAAGGVQGNGSAWGAAPAPEGKQAAFVQNLGWMAQNVSMSAGSHTLSFRAARRSWSKPAGSVQPIRVTIDGQQIGLVAPPGTAFTAYSLPFTVGSTGAHAIRFEGTDATGDKTTFIDAVVVTQTAAQSQLANGSFEQPALGSGFQYTPTGAGVAWSFSTAAGIQANGSAWGAASAPDGNQTAFVQNLGWISQSISLAAGTYTVTLRAARRGYSTPAGSVQPIRVTIDGQQIGQLVAPASTTFATYTVPFTVTVAGAHTLQFAGTDGSGDKSTFIDAVAITPQ